MYKIFKMPSYSRKRSRTSNVGTGASAPKVFDISIATATVGLVPLTPAIANFAGGLVVNSMLEGTSFMNRIGRTICMKKLLFKFIPTYSTPAASDIPQLLRCIIFYDAQINGAFTTLPNLMGNFNDPTQSSNNAQDFPNPDNRDRFVVLYDNTKLVQSGVTAESVGSLPGSNTSGINNYVWQGKLNLNNLETKFTTSGSANTAAQILSGGLCVAFTHMAVNGTVTSTVRYQVSCWTRLVYSD